VQGQNTDVVNLDWLILNAIVAHLNYGKEMLEGLFHKDLATEFSHEWPFA